MKYNCKKTRSVFNIKGRTIGDGQFMVIAGPCSVESQEQILDIAREVSTSGATVLRGSAFKPRTSPYDFQGMGAEGLKFLQLAANKHNLLCISEVVNTEDVALVAEYVDILQVGSRNMHNFSLLKAVGNARKPVLLKRGFAATYKEFLLAAEYILGHGNNEVILCERGIRTFETHTRNTLDIAAVPILRELTHLPIIVDPSHGTGLRNIVAPMALAAMAVQADGIMVEVHTTPDESITDAQQAISPAMFATMMDGLNKMAAVVNVQL